MKFVHDVIDLTVVKLLEKFKNLKAFQHSTQKHIEQE